MRQLHSERKTRHTISGFDCFTSSPSGAEGDASAAATTAAAAGAGVELRASQFATATVAATSGAIAARAVLRSSACVSLSCVSLSARGGSSTKVVLCELLL